MVSLDDNEYAGLCRLQFEVLASSSRQAGFLIAPSQYLDDKALSVSPRFPAPFPLAVSPPSACPFSKSPNSAQRLISNLLWTGHFYPCILHGLGQPQVRLNRPTPALTYIPGSSYGFSEKKGSATAENRMRE